MPSDLRSFVGLCYGRRNDKPKGGAVADTWQSIEGVAPRGGTWAAHRIGPRRVVISATTLTGRAVEVVVHAEGARELLASLADIVASWDAQDV